MMERVKDSNLGPSDQLIGDKITAGLPISDVEREQAEVLNNGYNHQLNYSIYFVNQLHKLGITPTVQYNLMSDISSNQPRPPEARLNDKQLAQVAFAYSTGDLKQSNSVSGVKPFAMNRADPIHNLNNALNHFKKTGGSLKDLDPSGKMTAEEIKEKIITTATEFYQSQGMEVPEILNDVLEYADSIEKRYQENSANKSFGSNPLRDKCSINLTEICNTVSSGAVPDPAQSIAQKTSALDQKVSVVAP